MRNFNTTNLKTLMAAISLIVGLSIPVNEPSDEKEKWHEKTDISHRKAEIRRELKEEDTGVIETEEGITFVVKAKADSIKMAFPFTGGMTRNGKDQWLVNYKLKDKDRSIVNWGYIAYVDGKSSFHHGNEWRGEGAQEAFPAIEELKGEVSEHVFKSVARDHDRDITVYLPPGHNKESRYPVVYTADGGWVRELARRIDPLITSGKLRPLVLVGIHSMPYDGTRSADFSDHDALKDIRGREYIKGYLSSQELIEGEDAMFANHMTLFTEEVPEWAEEQFGASPIKAEKFAAGYSNGAAFVASLLAERPEKLGAATILSLAGWPTVADSLDQAPAQYPKIYMAAGRYERGFLRNTEHVLGKLKEYGCDAQLKKRLTGHDMAMWNEELIHSLLDYFNDHLVAKAYPKEVVLQLESLKDKDQELRLKMESVKEEHGPQSQQYLDLVENMRMHDKDNMEVLESMINQYGWSHTSSTSKKANLTAFLILQHNALKYQEKYLPQVLASAKAGETPRNYLALLQDRILMYQGKEQIYGSQLVGLNGKLTVWSIKDPEQVDKRRASVGLQPLSEYLKNFEIEFEALPLEKMPKMMWSN